MDKKEIVSFTLAQMKEMAGCEFVETEYDGCIIARREPSEIPYTIVDLLRYPCRVDAFLMIVGTSGRVRISSNLNRYEVGKDTLFIKTPNDIIQIEEVEEFGCVAVVYDEEFMRKLQVDFRNMVSLFLRIQECPCIPLTEAQRRELLEVIDATAREISVSEPGPYYDEVVRSFICCGLYKVCDIVSAHIDRRPAVPASAKSRNEEYFRRFMDELGRNYKNQRSVGFYASQLCITPKYLTTLIKRVSGRTAAEWVDDYVVLEAKNLLRFSTMSVQEVAYHLNFPNQSFFGKYFKHRTGISPSAYKLQK